jgi:dsRNA-specific ribonuclease
MDGNERNKDQSEWQPRLDLQTLEKRVGFKFPPEERDYLIKALTPIANKKSAAYQLLEFFGDGTLRYVIPRLLKTRYPDSSHGELSRMYSLLTCNTNLAFMAYRLRLPYYLKFNSRPSINRKMLADAVEAVIGAIEVVGGINSVEDVCKKLFAVDMEVARFHEPQDTLLRMLQRPHIIDQIREQAAEESNLKNLSGNKAKLSYELHVINKKWGKLGHVSVLRLNRIIIVKNGEGYDAESANNNAAAIALLKLFPQQFNSAILKLDWRI